MTHSTPPTTTKKTTLPDWLETLPQQEEHVLETIVGGAVIQHIALTCDEYIALKEYLAALRGYRQEEQLQRMIDEENEGTPSDLSDEHLENFKQMGLHEIAVRLSDAREVFAEFPALVVAPKMPAMIEKEL